MAAIQYALASELAVGADHATLTDVINRPLKEVIIASGLAITVDPFPGFLPLTGGTVANITITGAFGCNGATAQGAYTVGAALAAYGAGANGFDSGANAAALHALVTAMRAALVANGILEV